MDKRVISIFGATGSVGTSTLDLVRLNPEKYHMRALTAGKNAEKLVELAREFHPDMVVIADDSQYEAVKNALAADDLTRDIAVMAGEDALVEAAKAPADWMMAAIMGCAGLPSTMAALEEGRAVAFANKESLVSAGHLMMDAAQKFGGILLPVDSEHNAIFQCLNGSSLDNVSKITLTASGGPFRGKSLEFMRGVTPAQAVAHPNWSMGAKISVDSATMMNKGLELIEACHLFPIGQDKIDIIVHPQSVIHSLVEYRDHSTLAQLGAPDMKIPIASALAWPDRMDTPCKPLDLAALARLDFEPLDGECFPAPSMCREAFISGGAAPAILNAANEVAVAAFLNEKIGFCDICAIVSETLTRYSPKSPQNIAEVRQIDKEARRYAEEYLCHRA